MRNRYLVDSALALCKMGVRVPSSRRLRKLSEIGYLADLLQRLQVTCVLDVGAHSGNYAYHLRRSGYGGLILSFEPVREQLTTIERLSQDDPDWKSFGIALGSEDTSREFNVILSGGERHVLSSLLDPDWQQLQLIGNGDVDRHLERKEVVHIRRLDSILATLIPLENARIFIKVDTQGYDMEVIKGTSGIIQYVVGMQSELSVTPLYRDTPHYTKCLEYYESLGFCLMNLTVVNRTPKGSILEYDCVMARLAELDRPPILHPDDERSTPIEQAR